MTDPETAATTSEPIDQPTGQPPSEHRHQWIPTSEPVLKGKKNQQNVACSCGASGRRYWPKGEEPPE